MLTCHSFGWIICSHAWHASIILSLLLMPTHLCKISLSLSLSLPSFSISPFSLFTQECVICGSVDGVYNIPAEHRREGQTRERWWKTTPLPPRLMYPSSPRSLILWSSSSTNFYCLFPPCNQSHRQVRCTAKYAKGLFLTKSICSRDCVTQGECVLSFHPRNHFKIETGCVFDLPEDNKGQDFGKQGFIER